jgi:hypothetical protein
MQVKHEMDYEYKSHNLPCQNWRVIPSRPLFILPNGTF